MTPHDGSPDDMHDDLDHSGTTDGRLDDEMVEALLARRGPIGALPAEYDAVADVLVAASAPTRPAELAAEGEMLAMFRAEIGTGATTSMKVDPIAEAGIVDLDDRRRGRRRISRAAAVGLAAGIVLGSTGIAAAATGRLPDPVQTVVHDGLSHVGIDVPRPAPRPPQPREPRPAPPTTAPRPGGSAPSGRPDAPPTSRPDAPTPPTTVVPTPRPSTPDTAPTPPTTAAPPRSGDGSTTPTPPSGPAPAPTPRTRGTVL